MKHFGTFVTTEQLPPVLADGTPVFVGVFLRLSCLFHLRLPCRLRLRRVGFRSRRCHFGGYLRRLGLCPCAAVREAGAYGHFHLQKEKKKNNHLFYSCYTKSVSNVIRYMLGSALKQRASAGSRNSLTKWTSSSSSGSSLMTMTGPGEVFRRRLAVGADGVSEPGFQDVLSWNISRVRTRGSFDRGAVLRRRCQPWFFFMLVLWTLEEQHNSQDDCF